MSYTVIIVEDEDLIRQEIEQCTPWERLGLIVVGTAANGIEGAELITRLNPDIVITDIRLPGRDGLEMVQSCAVDHAIILSGHSDFSYMRSAIRLGVFDYLLKPFDDAELEKALVLLVEKLKDEEQEISSIGKDHLIQRGLELPSEVSNHIVDNTIQIIAKQYDSCIGLQEVAEMLQVSTSHLSRIFKEYTSINFMQYLQAYRINRAIELLQDYHLNISMISTQCGFPTPGYFTKVFRKFLGKTPTQFRDALFIEHPE